MSSWVYFIRAPINGAIKIGWSRSPICRLDQLRGASPVELEPLGVIRGSKATEYALQVRFREYHSHCEWFRPCPELLEVISTAQPWPKKHVPSRRRSPWKPGRRPKPVPESSSVSEPPSRAEIREPVNAEASPLDPVALERFNRAVTKYDEGMARWRAAEIRKRRAKAEASRQAGPDTAESAPLR